ncbi:MAG: discoidin domain-containing protein [Anaerolineales bacterium]
MSHKVRRLAGLGWLVLLSACAPLAFSAGGRPEVRPIDEILVAPIRIEPADRSATVLVTTRLPVACAVVYGPSHAYGSIATDADMAGGAHADHHPVLAGLEPDTVYYLRLQGVGPDGTLYRSDEFTLHTLPAGTVSGQANLASTAAGARVSGVSSQFGSEASDGAYAAIRAIDGAPSTQWSSNGDGNDAWIEIELPAPTHITRVGFWTRTMGSSAQIYSFRIVTDQGQAFGPFELSDAAQIHYFPTDFSASRLRFEAVETSGGNTGAVEIEVYGELN